MMKARVSSSPPFTATHNQLQTGMHKEGKLNIFKKKAKKPAEVVKLSFSRKGSRSSHCGISIFMTNDGALLALQTVDPMKFLSDYYCCSRPPPSNLRK